MKNKLDRIIHNIKMFGLKHDTLCSWVMLLSATLLVTFAIINIQNLVNEF